MKTTSYILRATFTIILSWVYIAVCAGQYQHFIIYGQSLSAGSQSYPPLSLETVPGNWMIGNQIWMNYGHLSTDTTEFKPLRATEAASETKIDGMFNTVPIRDILCRGESPLVGAVNHIQRKIKGSVDESEIIATSCGTGGLTIEDLSKNASLSYYNEFTKSITAAARIAQKLNAQIICPAIFWMQGESNSTVIAGKTNSKEGYKALMIQLKNDMQADIKAKYGQEKAPVFITYQMGGQYIKTFKELPISMAQLEASNEYDDIICAGPVYPMTDRGGHLDANGYRWYGEMLGKVYYKTQILKEEFKPLQPLKFWGTSQPNELRIEFLVSHLPLAFDELLVQKVANYGFEIQLNGIRTTITNLTIDNNSVILTLANPITNQQIEVFYAGLNQSPAGHGNLRDSDPYLSYYQYVDLDGKDSFNKYIYPRGDAAGKDRNGKIITTLRPTPEPKNAAGQIIYNQSYPLYNFCVSFYKKIVAGQLQYTSVENIGQEEVIINTRVFDSKLIISSENNEIKKVEILSLEGKTVRLFDGMPQIEQEYSLSGLSQGVYLAKVMLSDSSVTSKIIIQ